MEDRAMRVTEPLELIGRIRACYIDFAVVF
jgi:hypothetical protein